MCGHAPTKFRLSKYNNKVKVVCQCGRESDAFENRADAIKDWNSINITPINI